MAWIKHNLYFVLGLAGAAVLLGVGVWYSISKKAAADEVSANLESASASLNQLIDRKPFPSDENIKAARLETDRVLQFKTNVLKRFPEAPVSPTIATAQFKALLEGAITGLERVAERNGVKLPSKYAFTFGEQRKEMVLDEKKLPVLAGQVIDIESICRVVFESRINELNSVRRPTLMTNDFGSDFLARKAARDDKVGILDTPYEISFNCFSAELAAVLSGLANAPQMLVVKSINIERPTSATADTPSPTPFPMGGLPGGAGMDPMIAARYGMGMRGRYGYGMGGGVPPPPVTPAPAPKTGAEVDEKLFRVTLGVDAVRPAPPLPKPPPAPKMLDSEAAAVDPAAPVEKVEKGEKGGKKSTLTE